MATNEQIELENAFKFIEAMENLMATNKPAVEMRKAIIELAKNEEQYGV